MGGVGLGMGGLHGNECGHEVMEHGHLLVRLPPACLRPAYSHEMLPSHCFLGYTENHPSCSLNGGSLHPPKPPLNTPMRPPLFCG